MAKLPPIKSPINNFVYRAAPGAGFSHDKANQVGHELACLSDKGVSTDPHTLLDVARSPQSAMHELLTWDDKEAAELRRLDEVRHVTSHLLLFETRNGEEQEPVKSFWSILDLSGDTPQKRQYMHVRDARSDPAARAQIKETAVQELQSWRAKYEAFGLDELSKTFDHIREFYPKE